MYEKMSNMPKSYSKYLKIILGINFVNNAHKKQMKKSIYS